MTSKEFDALAAANGSNYSKGKYFTSTYKNSSPSEQLSSMLNTSDAEDVSALKGLVDTSQLSNSQGTRLGSLGSLLSVLTGDSDYADAITNNADKIYAAEEAVKAYNREREYRQTSYQDTVADLKAAGLSPLLAYGSQSQGGSVASASSSSRRTGRSDNNAENALSGILRAAVQLAVSGISSAASMSNAMSKNATALAIANTGHKAGAMKYLK